MPPKPVSTPRLDAQLKKYFQGYEAYQKRRRDTQYAHGMFLKAEEDIRLEGSDDSEKGLTTYNTYLFRLNAQDNENLRLSEAESDMRTEIVRTTALADRRDWLNYLRHENSQIRAKYGQQPHNEFF